MDRRLHESASDEPASLCDWSPLDAHLRTCPSCEAEWNERRRVSGWLAHIAADRPNPEEVETMWNAIAMAAGGGPLGVKPVSRRGVIWNFLVGCGVIAAVLGVAFRIGYVRYGGTGLEFAVNSLRAGATGSGAYFYDDAGEGGAVGFEYDSAKPVSDPTVRTMPRRTPAPWTGSANDASGAGIPVHPEQLARGWAAESREDYLTLHYQDSATLADGSAADTHRILNHADSIEQAWRYDDLAMWTPADTDGVGGPDTNVLVVAGPPQPESPNVLPGMAAEESAGQHPVEDFDLSLVKEEVTFEPPARGTHTRIIKTGELTIEVDSYTRAVGRIEAIVREHDAFIADSSVREQTGGALAGRFVVRVAPERFEDLFGALKAAGRVEAENVKAADVTAEYVDLEARIAGLEITEKRLAELITNKSFVDKMSALLEVEREMTRVRSQIEQLTGQLRVMADRVALSTITLNVSEPPRTVPSASLSVAVPVLDEAAGTLADVLARLGGRLISARTSKRGDGTLTGDYGIRISLARFGELLSAIESLGNVEQRQVSDRAFGDTAAPWADTVQCNVGLVLAERSRELPTGSIRIEVNALASAIATLNATVTEYDAAIVANRTSRQEDGSTIAELRLRVPGGRFAGFVDSITGIGRTTSKVVSGEAGRIVGGAATAPCSLLLTLAEPAREVPRGHVVIEVPEFEQARKQLSSLVIEKEIQVQSSTSNQRTDGSWVGTFSLGIRARDMETAVARLETLGRVASRHLTGIGLGDLSRTDPDAISVISLTLGEKTALTPEPQRAGESIRRHLRDGLAGLYTSLGLIAYGLIVMVPWLVIVALLGWIVVRVRRRHGAARQRSVS